MFFAVFKTEWTHGQSDFSVHVTLAGSTCGQMPDDKNIWKNTKQPHQQTGKW